MSQIRIVRSLVEMVESRLPLHTRRLATQTSLSHSLSLSPPPSWSLLRSQPHNLLRYHLFNATLYEALWVQVCKIMCLPQTSKFSDNSRGTTPLWFEDQDVYDVLQKQLRVLSAVRISSAVYVQFCPLPGSAAAAPVPILIEEKWSKISVFRAGFYFVGAVGLKFSKRSQGIVRCRVTGKVSISWIRRTTGCARHLCHFHACSCPPPQNKMSQG